MVQARAKVRYLIRASDLPELTRLIERVRKIAEGAALMTETRMESQVVSAVSNLLANTPLEKAMYGHLVRLGPPPFDEADRAEAAKFQATLTGDDVASAFRRVGLPMRQGVSDGHFLPVRAVNTSNLGAAAISFVPLAKGIAVSSSVYNIPCSYMRGRAAVTNTSPTSAYRSAGRPEVMFILERLIDIACRRCGFDRLEIRRRNLVPPEAMPYRNPLGLVYDSGDYPASMRRAAELGDTGYVR